jgi:acyl transferase domain-containing protein
MSPFEAQLVQRLDGLLPQNGKLPVYSTVTGDLLEGRAWNASYWGRNMRQPVRFALAIINMARKGINAFLEISPHPVLSPMVERCLQAEETTGKVIYSLRRGKDDHETALGDTLSWARRLCPVTILSMAPEAVLGGKR